MSKKSYQSGILEMGGLLLKKIAYLFLILLVTAISLSGCSNETAAAEEPVPEVGVFALIEHTTNRVIVYVHGDHWHGFLPAMNMEDAFSMNVYVEDSDEALMKVDGEEHSLSAVIVDGDEDVVLFEFTGDFIQLTAEKPGESRVVFQLQHSGVVYYETPPISVMVNDPGEEAHEDEETEYGAVAEIYIIDRSDGQVVADIHGDHWHGRLPAVTEGSYVSLGAVMEDINGDEIILDGEHYSLGASMAEGSEAIVSFESHGDHIDVIGEKAGETRIVFQLLHDGSIEHETPSIKIEVLAP
jgi:hypothetical protein